VPLRGLAVGGEGDEAERDVGLVNGRAGEEVPLRVPLVEAPEGGDGVGAEGLGALKIGVGVVGWVVRGDGDVGVEADDFDEGVVGVGEVGGVPGYWIGGLRLVDGWCWGWIGGGVGLSLP
jgi:hypothetical protein